MSAVHASTFRVALTADFFGEDGALKFKDMGLSLLDEQAHIECAPFAEHHAEIGVDDTEIGNINPLRNIIEFFYYSILGKPFDFLKV